MKKKVRKSLKEWTTLLVTGILNGLILPIIQPDFEKQPYLKLLLMIPTVLLFIFGISLLVIWVCKFRHYERFKKIVIGIMIALSVIILCVIVLSPFMLTLDSDADNASTNEIAITGDENNVIAGDNNTINITVSDTKPIVELDFWDLTQPNLDVYAITQHRVFNALESCQHDSNVVLLEYMVTNTNDLEARIVDVKVETLNYEPLKDMQILSFSYDGEGECESQIYFDELTGNRGTEVLSYAGQEETWVAVDNYERLHESGTYVKIGAGEIEDLALVLKYQPGLYRFRINISYIIGENDFCYRNDYLYYLSPYNSDDKDYYIDTGYLFADYLEGKAEAKTAVEKEVFDNICYANTYSEAYDEIEPAVSSSFDYTSNVGQLLRHGYGEWIMEAHSPVVGEWIKFEFPHDLALIGICFDDYNYMDDKYTGYSLPAELLLEYSNGSSDILKLSCGADSYDNNLLFETPKRTSFVKMTILDTFEGAVADTYIGNVNFAY